MSSAKKVRNMRIHEELALIPKLIGVNRDTTFKKKIKR